MLQRALTLTALVLFGAGSLSAQEKQLSYELRPGDQVTISVFTAAGEQVGVVSGQRIINRAGDIFLPYVGTVHVAGLDENGLRELLTQRYGGFYSDPVVDVKANLRVSITGAVGRPGQYFLDPTSTIIDAIANAGGMGSEVAVAANQIPSDQGAVRLVRDGKTFLLDLRPGEAADSVLNMRIKSGDWINVPTRGRSKIRDDVQFWGGMLSFVTSIFGFAYLIGHH